MTGGEKFSLRGEKSFSAEKMLKLEEKVFLRRENVKTRGEKAFSVRRKTFSAEKVQLVTEEKRRGENRSL